MSAPQQGLEALPLLLIDLQATGPRPGVDHPFDLAWWLQTSAEDAIESCPIALPAPARLPAILRRRGCEPPTAGAWSPIAARERLAPVLGCSAAIVAHFVRFEAAWLRAWFGDDLPPLICLHALSRRLHPRLPSHALTALAGRLGSAPAQRHRSADHVAATRALWRALLADLAERDIRTLPALLDWLTAPAGPASAAAREYGLDRRLRLALPDAPGVYRYLDAGGQVLYVGKATSLHKRVNSYFRKRRGDSAAIRELLTRATGIEATVCASAVHAAILECREIQRLDPPFNTALKQSRRPLYWLAHDLGSVASAPDPRYRIGPWSGSWNVELWLAACEAVFDGDLSRLRRITGTLSDEALPPDTVRITLQAAWQHPADRRSLLARAIRRRRHDQSTETSTPAAEESSEGHAPPESCQSDASTGEAGHIPKTFDPITRCARALSTIAALHIRSRQLQRLRGRPWLWEEGGQHLSIHLSNAEGESKPDATSLARSMTAADWDLASVLAGELTRLRQNGCRVWRLKADGVRKMASTDTEQGQHGTKHDQQTRQKTSESSSEDQQMHET